MHNFLVPFGNIWNILILATYLSTLSGTKQYEQPSWEDFFFALKQISNSKMVSTPMHKSWPPTISSPRLSLMRMEIEKEKDDDVPK